MTSTIGADQRCWHGQTSVRLGEVDTNSQEFQLLLRQFEKGSVVLFAGAGFSLGAQNSLGTDPPLGGSLSTLLAEECGWQHGGEELSIVYDQALKHLGTKGLNEFLARHYRGCRPAAWHF